MKNRVPLVLAGLLNLVAWSVVFVVIVSLKCERGHNNTEATRIRNNKSESAALPVIIASNTANIGHSTTSISTAVKKTFDEPSYLQWNPSTPPNIPNDWKFTRPRFCKNIANFRYDNATHGKQTIIVHHHMQHNAGTRLWGTAREFVPCALRSCWQKYKHCMVSYDENVEANHIRDNFKKYGVQYHSYELMLPPRFSLPFVSEEARRDLFFTTIVRDPFKRLLTYARRHNYTEIGYKEESPFWIDLQTGNQGPYAGDNLNARWLSGAQEQLSNDHVNIAKCRLQLFDLVIADKLYEYALKKVICPLNNWKGALYCNDKIKKIERQSKPDPLNETDPMLIGAWIERLRPSFEIYDYARILSWKQMKERGVQDLPVLSEVPSYMETLARYTNLEVTDSHLKNIRRVSVKNEGYFQPPVEFCDGMKRVWTSNPDGKRSVCDIFRSIILCRASSVSHLCTFPLKWCRM
mmetsp:Transcript_5129/g.9321  ORF Transcript_5129/g.9321 Transcript_5129/m.9321 type:complete len:464 (-) Transcript_5129:94-1485(-)